MDELCHYGIKGQKWGVRRFQNSDGSYTSEGKRRAQQQEKKDPVKEMKDEDLRKAITRLSLENKYKDLTKKPTPPSKLESTKKAVDATSELVNRAKKMDQDSRNATKKERMANILVDNIKPIYPLPDRVQARPSTAIGEVRRTKAPSVLAELGYHDNVDDANWLTGNLDTIAQALSVGVTEYFGLPFLIPGEIRDGKVATNGSSLNLRGLPSTDGAVLAQMPNGASVRILAEYNDWYSIFYDGLYGFAERQYIAV